MCFLLFIPQICRGSLSAASNIARGAVGGVKICDSVWRRLKAWSLTFVHVIVNYKSFSARCASTCGLILLSVWFVSVFVWLGSNKIKSLKQGEHYLYQTGLQKHTIGGGLCLVGGGNSLSLKRAKPLQTEFKKKKNLLGSSGKSIVLIFNSTKWHKNKECIFRKRNNGKNNKI